MAAGTAKFRKSSPFGDIIDSVIGGGTKVLDFVDFFESPLAPKVKLRPVQYMLGKILFGIPLDRKEVIVPVYDRFREKLLYELPEREFLKYLYEHGQTHIGDWHDLSPHGYTEQEVIAGRRGGKSAYVAACSHYMLYRLLAIRNPQDYYGLIEGSTIDFTILAQNEEGSDRLYGQVRNGVNTCEFFRPYLYGVPGANELKLITEADRGKRDVLPSITVASLPCTTRSARGPSSIFLVLDEFAFFRNALGARSDEVYDSAKPATMQFVNPDGLCDAKVLTITSPWTRVGTVWDLHQRAMQQGADSAVFSLRVGTAIMNPKAPSSFLKEEFDRKPATWEAEYGGNFIDSAGSLVPPERIDFCVDTGRPNKVGFHQSSVGQVYFWGIDLGLKKDATALAIGHWEQDERGRPILIYDYIKRMIVGDEEHRNVDQLDVDEILNWFENMNMWLPGAFGATDQYAGASFITLCALRGINFIDLVHLTGGINSQMYFALQGYLNQGICRFPDYQPFVQELKNVEAFYVGKTTLKVEAPNEKDAHDDMCDAVALVAWQAQKWMLEVGNKGLAFSGYGSLLKPEDRPSIGNVDIQASSMSQLRMAESMRRSQWATARRGMLRS